MKNLFEQSRSHWVRYDHYELKTAEDGKRYITPGKNAKPDVYNPLKEVPNIVLDALNVGMLLMGRKPEAEVEKAVMEFVTRYGLLGLMTALPTTPTFMDYEAVYLPKNHFIKEECVRRPDHDCPDHDLHGRADGEEHELPAGICGTLQLGCSTV